MLRKRCRTFGSKTRKEVTIVSKARLYHLAVVACLIAFALYAAASMFPLGPFDGNDF